MFFFLTVTPYFGYGSIKFNDYLSSYVPVFTEGGSLVPSFYYTIGISGFAMFPAITVVVTMYGNSHVYTDKTYKC